MAITKVSSKNTDKFVEKMKKYGMSDKDISKAIREMEEEGSVSSSNRSSIQFKDKNDNSWRASLTWKSVDGGTNRVDSLEMIEMRDYFEKGKKKFGELTSTEGGI